MNRKTRRLTNANHNSHGLYFHSSIPKALTIKPSSIRIWIHDKDIDKLMRVVLEGHGGKLRNEMVSNVKVKRFLSYVPHFMGMIKSIHAAVIENNIELLRAKTSPPVPPQMLNCKDVNGLTPLHKASGLGHTKIVEYLTDTWPSLVHETDNNGRTALHYAAAMKNNDRTFYHLVQAGSDELAMDGKGRNAAYYKKGKNGEEIDRNLLTLIPDAPRVSEQGFPPNFSWDFLPAKFFDVPIKASQSHMNLSAHTESHMKQSSSAFEILSRTMSNDELLNDNEPIKEEEPPEKKVDAPPIQSVAPAKQNKQKKGKDLNNNLSAKLPKLPPTPPPDEKTEDFEIIDQEEEKTNLTDTETLLSEQKLNGQQYNHHDMDDKKISNDVVNEELLKKEENAVEIVENLSSEAKEVVDNKLAEIDQTIASNVEEAKNVVENVSETIQNEQSKLDETINDIKQSASKHEDHLAEKLVENLEATKESVENKIDQTIEKISYPPMTFDGRLESPIEKEGPSNIKEETNEKLASPAKLSVHRDAIEERAKSSDTYDVLSGDEVDKEIEKVDTQPMVEDHPEISSKSDTKVDILVIDNNAAISEENEELLSDKEIKTIQKEYEDEEFDDDNDVVVSPQRNLSASASKPIKTGDCTKDEDEHMDEYEGESADVGSPSPPYEGVIKEEAERQLESKGGDFEEIKHDTLQVPGNEKRPEDDIQKLIDAGDMEELAVLVLNGDGNKLTGRTSSQPDIQAFLENIPLYMVKIRKVHMAAREGSMRDLQAALDRRKFSTAKDEVSPNGATPLHVAIIFGHTSIIRYLGSRFPETISAVDDDNRSSLHYAATLSDNGHFYNLLVTLGADAKAVDNFGHSAEFYLNHEESDKVMSHKDLLRRFGAAETLADDMLNDQGSQQPVEIPLFRTEEGRYLATSLGDPLIKGLTEVANQRPQNPIQFLANYLQNFVNDGMPKAMPPNIAKQNGEVKQKEEVKNHVKPKSVTKVASIQKKAKSIENLMDEEEYDATPGADERDEHGQSMLHFAAARQHGKNALFQLIEESGVSLTYRDEIYRTARDVSLQASQPENCKEIDRYVLSLAARGDYETFAAMLLEGYDHIIDVCDDDGFGIAKVAQSRGHHELARFLDDLADFEENREKLLNAIRNDDIEIVKEVLSRNDGNKLARAKNYYGRCSLHVAVLLENEEIVEYIASNFRQTLKVGDNLERTALHYSMGINNVESISRILIKNGAKRVLKDLKGRTASFYYMNKGDILRLQEEEKN